MDMSDYETAMANRILVEEDYRSALGEISRLTQTIPVSWNRAYALRASETPFNTLCDGCGLAASWQSVAMLNVAVHQGAWCTSCRELIQSTRNPVWQWRHLKGVQLNGQILNRVYCSGECGGACVFHYGQTADEDSGADKDSAPMASPTAVIAAVFCALSGSMAAARILSFLLSGFA